MAIWKRAWIHTKSTLSSCNKLINFGHRFSHFNLGERQDHNSGNLTAPDLKESSSALDYSWNILEVYYTPVACYCTIIAREGDSYVKTTDQHEPATFLLRSRNCHKGLSRPSAIKWWKSFKQSSCCWGQIYTLCGLFWKSFSTGTKTVYEEDGSSMDVWGECRNATFLYTICLENVWSRWMFNSLTFVLICSLVF